jgi:hypothetical protein
MSAQIWSIRLSLRGLPLPLFEVPAFEIQDELSVVKLSTMSSWMCVLAWSTLASAAEFAGPGPNGLALTRE